LLDETVEGFVDDLGLRPDGLGDFVGLLVGGGASAVTREPERYQRDGTSGGNS